MKRIQIAMRPFMRPLVRFFMYFFYETSYTMGSSGRVVLGKKVALGNTLLNISSGSITIGDYSIFGPNVMLITGRHNFKDGKRAGMDLVVNSPAWGGGSQEVPDKGYDITIGSGCWIAAGVIVSGGVTIGDNVIVAAGSVVTKDLPDFTFAAGVPAKILGDTRNHGK